MNVLSNDNNIRKKTFLKYIVIYIACPERIYWIRVLGLDPNFDITIFTIVDMCVRLFLLQS